jgi:hypothetical protein
MMGIGRLVSLLFALTLGAAALEPLAAITKATVRPTVSNDGRLVDFMITSFLLSCPSPCAWTSCH